MVVSSWIISTLDFPAPRYVTSYPPKAGLAPFSLHLGYILPPWTSMNHAVRRISLQHSHHGHSPKLRGIYRRLLLFLLPFSYSLRDRSGINQRRVQLTGFMLGETPGPLAAYLYVCRMPRSPPNCSFGLSFVQPRCKRNKRPQLRPGGWSMAYSFVTASQPYLKGRC